MASDVAQPPQIANGDAVDGYQSALNSHNAQSRETHMSSIEDGEARPPAPVSQLQAEPTINLKDTSSTPSEPNVVEPVTPNDNVAATVPPVADIDPKDDATTSHPTPPPDAPFANGAAADVEMAGAHDAAEPIALAAPTSTFAEPLSASSEQSLVRPRDDDDDDEPAAKRSRVDDVSISIPPAVATAPVDVDPPPATSSASHEPSKDTQPETASDLIKTESDVPVAASIAPADRDAPANDTAMAEPTPNLPEASEVKTEQPGDSKAAAEPTVPPPQSDEKLTSTSNGANATTLPNDTAQSTQAAPSMHPATATYDTRPLTQAQKNVLAEKMKNLKKTKNSLAFLRPVDPIALNIPNYHDIITHPMDLGTMENKLRDGIYSSVQDFAKDFDLIISNTRRFNGDSHPVTISGLNMDAYFRRMMETVPSADSAVPPPAVPKKRSPSGTRERRRESRTAASAPAPAPTAASPVAPPAASPTTTYALNNDGTPQLRRDSNRPQRAIKPPQNREITYAKPKRKEHQLELRFCEYVLDEVRGAKYGRLNHVFLHPVDPVALNIPQYRQIVKNPMDLSTMSQKLKGGQYSTATEFKKDFELMIKNCLLFNPVGNVVRDLGIQFQREFETLWATKPKWERQNQPASNRASSASVADDSAEEEEEESDVEDKNATIRALKKQLAEMQNTLSVLDATKPVKTKKSKASKTSGSKKSGTAAPAKASKGASKTGASKPKKVRQVTYEEKQEISEAVGNMSEVQVNKLTQIITSSCEKYRDMDEMELEIDDLPNDVQAKLLEFVRSIFGKPKKVAREASPDDAAAIDDDDFEPEKRVRGGGGGKRKKNKPMRKEEQLDHIKALNDKLAQFSQPGTSRSESPTNSSFNAARVQAESSGDEESEESEEE